MGYTRVVTAGIFALLLAGCATASRHPGAQVGMDREALLSGPPGLAAPAPEVDVLALDDEMRAYLAERIPKSTHDWRKARMLLETLFADDGVRLRYNRVQTYTAIETFHAREGNCLSFTNLFIAMARELGLQASFQEVETPATWDDRGQLYISSRHINVLLRYKVFDDQVVDFDITNFNQAYRRKTISDQAALAQYHNNMSVHWLLQEEPGKALAHQKLALKLAPRTGYMWTNLGVVYSRFGYPDYAEAAFLTALSYGRDNLLAVNNLARLYAQQGETELAAFYDQQAESFRRRNPFYLYALAKKHYAAGEYTEARAALRRAIRFQPTEHEFYQLLGLTELSMGDADRARESFELALEYAREPEEEELYNRKLRLLAGVKAE